MIKKASKLILYFLGLFRFIHNGRIQMYVLYGFIFIMAMIIATFLKML